MHSTTREGGTHDRFGLAAQISLAILSSWRSTLGSLSLASVCPKSRSRPTQPNRLIGVSARQSYTTTLLTVDMSDDDEEDDDRH
ncbi:MAG TPA: hypothetical protein VE999_16155 [Gemmataceae bacterium]|nr:hypothetical protein [Gemmataceae bacterium]